MKHASTAMMILFASAASSETERQLDTHEHGVGALNIAIEGTTVAMEFRAPGADIVGFEHAATSAQDRAAIDAAVAILAKPMALFVLPAEAACSVVQASAELESDAFSEADEAHDAHDHDAHADHDDEAHADHDEHDHDEHDHDHSEQAAHDDHDAEEAHAGHDHDAHEEGASHSEFHAEYTLNCAAPEAVTSITFDYFDQFENARELEVQIVGASGAQAFEVMRDAPRIDVGNLF